MPPAATTSVAPLVFIFGDDDFAVRQRARQIFQQWSEELGGMDHEIINAAVGNGGEALAAIGKLREALQTLPFFGTGKAVWFQDCNFLGDDRTASSSAVTEALVELAQELKKFSWDKVRLVFSAGKVDKRKTFYKTIEKTGSVENFSAWSTDDKDWAMQAESAALKQLRGLKKEISDEALALLVTYVGPNARHLANETEKLALYAGDRPEIVSADVEAVVTRQKQARAFALGDALGDRDLPRVLRTLDAELWEMKLDPQKSEIGLLYGLITKVRAMIFLKEMTRAGWISADLSDRDYNRFKTQLERVPADKLPADKRFNPLALNPYVLFRAMPHSKKYSLAELVRAMNLLLECNRKLVSSSLDEALVLQQTMVQIVGSAAVTARR